MTNLKIIFSDINGVFNVGSGKGKKINEVISNIEKFVNTSAKKEFINSRINDITVNVLNIDKFIETFGPVKFTEFETGLKSTVEYFKEEKII